MSLSSPLTKFLLAGGRVSCQLTHPDSEGIPNLQISATVQGVAGSVIVSLNPEQTESDQLMMEVIELVSRISK